MTKPNSDASSIRECSAADLADRLHSSAIHLLRRLRREDDAIGISAPRLSALSVVVFGGPLTMGDLARAEQVQPPTMTRIVQALEGAGYVRRAPHPDDGRAVLLTATPEGKRILEEGRRRRLAVLTAQVAMLAPDDRSKLHDGVAILEEKVLGLGPCRPSLDR